MDENKLTRWVLIAILLLGMALRFYDLNWDQSQHAHPDERWIAMVAPTIRWPARTADLLDPRRSTLNPLWVPDGHGGGEVRNFAYGHLPLYMHAFVGQAMSALGRQMLKWGEPFHETAHTLQMLGEYGGITLVGRVLSALSDLGIIYLIFLLGRRLYGDQVGLLAAALIALAPMHIQLAHFATFDVLTTFFILLSLYGAVCVLYTGPGQWAPTIWGGLAAGLAIASKFNAVPLLAAPIVAQVIRAIRMPNAPATGWLRRAMPGIVVSMLCALLAFALTSPFALLDTRLYIKQILEQSTMVRGVADWPFTRQYRNTLPFVYQIVEQVRWGLGWPLGISAFAGFGWTLLRQFRRHKEERFTSLYDAELILLCWSVPYFLVTGSFMVKFMRYMLPLLPLFILMGTAMVIQIAEWANRQSEKGQAIKRRNVPYAVLAWLPHVLLFSTLIWGLAFMRVYEQEHPWIQASKWIYQNLPDGSVIAVEHWDDHLPLALPLERATPEAHGYRWIELPMYEADNYEKYDLLRIRLQEADYLILSTNRLYRTIPRLPERYPIGSEFYRLLFAGELGFERVAEFTAYPGLFGLTIVDDAADESFTVYDHPKPIIFKKTKQLDYPTWDRLFETALSTPPVWTAEKKFDLFTLFERKSPQQGQVSKTLLLDMPVGKLPVVADWGWNDWASGSTFGSAVLATLLWWLTVTLIGALAFPIVFVVFRGLRDRGYLLSRSIGLLLLGYIIWLPSSMRWLPNGLPLTLAALLLIAGASTLLLRRYGSELKSWLREHKGMVGLGEAIFGLALVFFVGIRMLNPDLWHPWNGGEKGMDLAYLNACMRSAYFPPYDPYFAHGYLNYYYYGQFLVSIITRLTGLRTSVAFNLAVPLYFALTVSNVFSIGYTLAGQISHSPQRRTRDGIAHGLLAVLMMALLGNLDSMVHIIEQLGMVGRSAFVSRLPGVQSLVYAANGLWRILMRQATFPGFNYWDRSRVVGLTINEFPYWSFLFADLHPHMMNIPFTALVIAFALNWWLRRREPFAPTAPLDLENRSDFPRSEWSLVKSSFRYLWQRLDWGEMLVWPLWALALGALAAINTWDFPAFAGLSGLILLLVWTRDRGRQGIGPALLAGIGLAAGGLLLYAPFFKYYTALFVGIGWSLGRTSTNLGEFLTVWGLMLFIAFSFMLLAWQRSRLGALRLLRLGMRYLPRLHRLEAVHARWVHPTPAYRRALGGMLALIVLLALLAWKGYWVLFLMVPWLILAFVLLVEPSIPAGRRFIMALIWTAFLILVGVELFYLKDFLAGDTQGWWRMNTLFKFYMQVWMLLGVATGAALPAVWAWIEQQSRAWRVLWQTTLTILLISAALFLPLGTVARVTERFPNAHPPLGTLDGMDFMTVGVYTWPTHEDPIPLYGDYAAIRWLNEHIQGTPVIAEAPLGYYREFGVRVASFTGLPTLVGMHQSEQRYSWDIGRRDGLARDLFTWADLTQTMAIIDELQIEYIYFGPLERTYINKYVNELAPGSANEARRRQMLSKFEQLAANGQLRVIYKNDLVTIYQVNR